ncbi:MAG: 50S ribosomal protein L11 methyltransferase [Desulfobulbaceae bacterium]|nr:50S ribosomal protein L11 methyltransferase [Desulfobulbaceae bacterium]HIJ91330.1 50S ribosomal protein L11 methyltransferase [Deltaproteobacteria bacterium]
MNPANPSAKSWLRITITASESISDPIADFICEQTGGVEQIPVTAAGAAQEQIIGYLENSPHAQEKLKKITEYLAEFAYLTPGEGKTRLETEIIPDEDWNKAWKERFKPLPITAHLVIKPTWESYQAANGEKVIEMDPGMAFGTGHHASTKLALEFIEELFHGNTTPPQTVLDVGTGTGILAMAAALFGAQEVLAIDNDPEAVAVAEENILRNDLLSIIKANGLALQDIPQQYDLVIANIIHDTLIELAAGLAARLAPNGKLIMAGILTGPQTENIRAAYTALGLKHQETREEGEWSALLFARA